MDFKESFLRFAIIFVSLAVLVGIIALFLNIPHTSTFYFVLFLVVGIVSLGMVYLRNRMKDFVISQDEQDVLTKKGCVRYSDGSWRLQKGGTLFVVDKKRDLWSPADTEYFRFDAYMRVASPIRMFAPAYLGMTEVFGSDFVKFIDGATPINHGSWQTRLASGRYRNAPPPWFNVTGQHVFLRVPPQLLAESFERIEYCVQKIEDVVAAEEKTAHSLQGAEMRSREHRRSVVFVIIALVCIILPIIFNYYVTIAQPAGTSIYDMGGYFATIGWLLGPALLVYRFGYEKNYRLPK